MERLKFIGTTSIRTSNNGKDVNLHPGETYNKKDLSNDYLLSLVAQGFFEEVVEEPKEEVSQTNTTGPASDKQTKTPKPK